MTMKDSGRPVNTTSHSLFSSTAARWGFYAVSLGFFLVVLDTTALNVAIGAMQREYNRTNTQQQREENRNTKENASLLLTCGAIGDRFGSRRFYQIGLLM